MISTGRECTHKQQRFMTYSSARFFVLLIYGPKCNVMILYCSCWVFPVSSYAKELLIIHHDQHLFDGQTQQRLMCGFTLCISVCLNK